MDEQEMIQCFKGADVSDIELVGTMTCKEDRSVWVLFGKRRKSEYCLLRIGKSKSKSPFSAANILVEETAVVGKVFEEVENILLSHSYYKSGLREYKVLKAMVVENIGKLSEQLQMEEKVLVKLRRKLTGFNLIECRMVEGFNVNQYQLTSLGKSLLKHYQSKWIKKDLLKEYRKHYSFSSTIKHTLVHYFDEGNKEEQVYLIHYSSLYGFCVYQKDRFLDKSLLEKE